MFYDTCKNNQVLSLKLTKKLVNHILKHQDDDDYSLAIIYAAEALGYVANFSPKARNAAFECLYRATSKHGQSSRLRDFVWASIISMERTFIDDLDIERFQDLINLDDDFLRIAYNRLKIVYDQSTLIRGRL